MSAMAPQLLFQQAVSLHQQGKLTEAELLYLQVMAAAPENFPTRYMFALLRYQQKRRRLIVPLWRAHVIRNWPARAIVMRPSRAAVSDGTLHRCARLRVARNPTTAAKVEMSHPVTC